MLTRRSLLTGGALAIAASRTLPARPTGRLQALPSVFAQLERDNGGRLGVAVLDTGSGERVGHRADERFAMCSTFKWLLAAAVLQRIDTGHETLAHLLPVPPKPLIGNSPLTEEHAGGAMSVTDLCGAILTRSDNTAANILLETLGGPSGITAFARSLGDPVTRLDRTETTLNQALPGDPRDTTSPAATLGNLRKLLLGDILTPASRDRLTQWMTANQTGATRIRARLPQGWRAADKTGSNLENTANDIALFWPPHGAPILVAAYLTLCPGPEEKRSAVLAAVGRLVTSAYPAA